ncbi:unnamed protein product [Cunninghamella blakesleeana]
MSDWEEEQEIEVSIPVKKKWEDEDEEDDVKDDWEDSDEEEKPQEKKPAPVIKKKVPLAQKIAEKKAAEEARKKEIEEKKAAMAARGAAETEEEKFEKKQRERQLELESDMNHATDLFAGVSVSKPSTESIESMKPKTRVEFENYRKRLSEMIVANSKSMHYASFIDQLVRELCVPMKDMDVRKASSSLTALANDKQRQAKEATKSKKKGKPSLAASGKADALDQRDYDREYDDFDDFM